MKKVLKGAAIALGTTALVLASAPIAGAVPDPGCRGSYVTYDPDEGSGVGWSYCDADPWPTMHRARVLCDHFGSLYNVHTAWTGLKRTEDGPCTGGDQARGAYTEYK